MEVEEATNLSHYSLQMPRTMATIQQLYDQKMLVTSSLHYNPNQSIQNGLRSTPSYSYSLGNQVIWQVPTKIVSKAWEWPPPIVDASSCHLAPRCTAYGHVGVLGPAGCCFCSPQCWWTFSTSVEPSFRNWQRKSPLRWRPHHTHTDPMPGRGDFQPRPFHFINKYIRN